MKGVILAAGKGSRLYPVTHVIPKPLLPIANKMTLAYAFEKLQELGIDDIAIVVGENENAMRDALGDGSAHGVHLSYVRQPEPKGLAHALGFAKEFVDGDDFVLYLGDAMYGEGFVAMRDRFVASGCANLNLVKEVPDPERFGVAIVDAADRIISLVEKPSHPESNLAMAGLYFFGPQIWEVLPDLKPSARGEYEITDAIQQLVDRGELVLAGRYRGAWFDTGTLDSFLETNGFIIDGGSRIAASAIVEGTIGANVVIGENAQVHCRSIANSVILPGTKVHCSGDITRAILGGDILPEETFDSVILHGAYQG